MSVSELTARPIATASERSLSGWGRTAWSRCSVYTATAPEEVHEALLAAAQTGRGLIARGAGRSYGDAAQNDGGAVLDTTALDRVLWIDREQRLVRAQAGATIGALMARLAAHGLTVPVVPGTRHVTLAGAIASDIHGKNHHSDGAFAAHVTSISLCTPADALVEVSRESDAELFDATLGGMGLTGVILEATLRAAPLPSPWVAVDTDRTNGLSETLELLAGTERHRYQVAWLDMLAPGSRMGRAVITRADPMPADAAPTSGRARRRAAAYPGELSRAPLLEVPAGFSAGLLRPASVRAFNALNWRVAPRRSRERPQRLAPYFFPLDVAGSWNRMYGADGLLQYQFAIPSGEEAALEQGFELLRTLPVYLAVFKRFGAASAGPLSFPLEGWTLAADIPAGAPGVGSTLAALDRLVAGCGGRVYLSKDARLRAEGLRAMYPALDRFLAVRERVDPHAVLASDLARRVGLCEASS